MTARDHIIESNLLLVLKEAMRKRNRILGKSLDESDLVQAGNEGLFRAVAKFDPDLGFTFSTYAVNWIREHMERMILNQGATVRVPMNRIKAGEAQPQEISSDTGTVCLDYFASEGDAALELVAESDLRGLLRHVLSSLKDLERLVIEHRFGLSGHEPKSLEGTARVVGRTREAVRQIQIKALRKMRELAEDLELRHSLGN